MEEEERYVRSFDGTQLYVSTLGAGPPIVMCDGLGCAGFIWKHLKQTLRAHHQMISWNYRGHGLSDRPARAEALGVEALCADLQAVLRAFGHSQVILFGHSMGVQIILQFALTFPDKVRALVPICGSYGRPLDTWHDHGLLGQHFGLLRRAVQTHPAVARRLWRRILQSKLAYAFASRFEVNGRLVEASDFRPYFEHLSGMDVQIFMQLLQRLQEHSVEPQLGNIVAPTLVIAGERDSFTPAWLSRRMHAGIGGSQLMVVADGSHIVPIESPTLVGQRIERFLQEYGLGGDVKLC